MAGAPFPPGPQPPPGPGQPPFGSAAPPRPGDYPAPKKSGPNVGLIVVIFVVAILLAGGAVTFFALRAADNAADTATEQIEDAIDQATDALSSDGEARTTETDRSDTGESDESSDEAPAPGATTASTIPGGVDLWHPSVAASFAQQYDDAIPGEPTPFVDMTIYTDYAFATAQDPTRPERVDSYGWRDGRVGEPDPEPDDPDLAGRTFTIDEVPWEQLEALVAEAESQLAIDEISNRYIIIDKGRFDDVDGVAIRVYISGPRRSGYVLADGDGTVVRVVS